MWVLLLPSCVIRLDGAGESSDTDSPSPCDDPATWFWDADGDGWGDERLSTQACDPGPGLVTTTGDCDDLDRAVHPEATEDCSSGKDEDCDGPLGTWDGLVDCVDPDCASDPSCTGDTETACDDTLDNDLDGDIDCADLDCALDPACVQGTETVCDDTLDNDLDGDTDCADDDCARSQACWCPGGEVIPNSSFELPALAPGGRAAAPGWTVEIDLPHVYYPTTELDLTSPLAWPADGNQVLNLIGSNCQMSIDLGISSELGKTYTMKWLAARTIGGAGFVGLQGALGSFYGDSTFYQFRETDLAEGTWTEVEVVFVAAAPGAPLEFRIGNASTSQDVYVDNLCLTVSP